jgi:hypothetical protein
VAATHEYHSGQHPPHYIDVKDRWVIKNKADKGLTETAKLI